MFLSEWYLCCFSGRLFVAVVWSHGVSLVQMTQHWTTFDLFVNLERYVVWPSCTIPFILVSNSCNCDVYSLFLQDHRTKLRAKTKKRAARANLFFCYLDLLVLKPFSLSSPFSITRFNFFLCTRTIKQRFAFSLG